MSLTLPSCLQDEDSEAILAADFEIGHFIRERIVPRAVLYFTGEAIEDDDDDVSIVLVPLNRGKTILVSVLVCQGTASETFFPPLLCHSMMKKVKKPMTR